MNARLLADPSFLISRRGQVWLDRAQRDAPGFVMYPAAFLRLDVELQRHFVAMSWAPLFYGYLSSSPNEERLLTDTDHGGAISTPDDVAIDCARAISEHGLTLFARRTETIDLFVHVGYSVLHSGPAAYAKRLETIRNDLGLDLADSLARRARFLLWSEGGLRPTGEEEYAFVLADQGKGAVR